MIYIPSPVGLAALNKDLSSLVRAYIAHPVPLLSREFPVTASVRLYTFTRHPAFHDIDATINANEGFPAKLKSTNKSAYNAARTAARKIKQDLARDEAMTRVLMRTLVVPLAMLADSVRGILQPRRPRAVVTGASRACGVTMDVTRSISARVVRPWAPTPRGRHCAVRARARPRRRTRYIK
jgi:hypothetical protein